MIANSQWSGFHQQRRERISRQFDCSCFGYTSPGVAGTLLIELATDLREVENSREKVATDIRKLENICEGDELDLYVDLPLFPLEDTGNVEIRNLDRDYALNVKAEIRGAVGQVPGLVSLYSADMHEGRMSSDVLTYTHGLTDTPDDSDTKDAILRSDTCCIGPGDTENGSTSEEKREGKRPLDSSKMLSTMEMENHQVSSLYQAATETVQELSQNYDGKRLRKRACVFSEVENSKCRKVTVPASVSSSKDECQSPVKMIQKSAGTSSQWRREASKVRIASGNDTRVGRNVALLDIKSAQTNGLYKAQLSSTHEDSDREEEALELQQCVSLLRKYGVLKSHDFYLSQNLPDCVPHPGSVGDGLLSKVCKTCGALEDPNSTVICDDCQEAFHLACCLPRMSSKYFDREDNWYCSSCRKQKKKSSTEGSSSLGILNSFKVSQSGLTDNSGNLFPIDSAYNSRVRLGPAHQADVPPWTGRVEDDDLEIFVAARPGKEVLLSQEEKDAEKDHMLKTFKDSLLWTPAKILPQGMRENWLQCQGVWERAFKDSDGRKHVEVACGKWRRAPLNVEQTENWECFCVIEWDPLHADCAVPQELPTEEILRRMQVNSDEQVSEVFLKEQIT